MVTNFKKVMMTAKLHSIAQSLPSRYNDAEVGLFEFSSPPLKHYFKWQYVTSRSCM